MTLEAAKAFAAIYNNLKKYPTVADVAQALGHCSDRSVRKQASEIRRTGQGDEGWPKLANRAQWVRPDVPASEHEDKFRDLTAQACIDELLRVQALDPEVELTRNGFRNNSAISDATWNRHFGTFTEFKRQAGLKLSRSQHAMERAIAKHASVDHYRRINIERQDYADKYERINDNRFKTILTCSDLHDIEIDPFLLRVLLDTAKRVQPDVIVLVGDIFDLPEFGKYGVDPREWDVVGRIRFAHENILRPLREACPNTQIDFIEGNHEARLLRQLADATPALRAVLSDLHGFTVGKLLGLDEFQINYIAKADLAAWTKRDFDREIGNNYKVYFDSVICHHFPHARNMGLPGVNGHNHQHQAWGMFSPIYGPYEWHQIGAGHRRSASYCEGEKWHNGFCLVNVDTQTRSTNFDYIAVTDFAVAGGKWYHREASEYEASVPKSLLAA
ncbi:MAG: metallophosphoesterase [Betaproteobacteria bacterium]|nr:metallophosphoesterase [Betaproteobacteria bacterium]